MSESKTLVAKQRTKRKPQRRPRRRVLDARTPFLQFPTTMPKAPGATSDWFTMRTATDVAKMFGYKSVADAVRQLGQHFWDLVYSKTPAAATVARKPDIPALKVLSGPRASVGTVMPGSAVVATSTRRNMAHYFRTRQGRDSITISGCDFLGAAGANTGAVGTVSFKQTVNPVAIVSSRLSLIAPMYERYVFKKFQVHYQTATPTSVSGSYIGYFDRDAADPLSTTGVGRIGVAYAHAGVRSVPVWQDMTWDMPNSPGNYYVDIIGSTASADPADLRMTYQAVFFLLTENTSGSAASGNLWIEYEIVLSQMKYDQALQGNMYMNVNSPVLPATATPWGLVAGGSYSTDADTWMPSSFYCGTSSSDATKLQLPSMPSGTVWCLTVYTGSASGTFAAPAFTMSDGTAVVNTHYHNSGTTNVLALFQAQVPTGTTVPGAFMIITWAPTLTASGYGHIFAVALAPEGFLVTAARKLRAKNNGPVLPPDDPFQPVEFTSGESKGDSKSSPADEGDSDNSAASATDALGRTDHGFEVLPSARFYETVDRKRGTLCSCTALSCTKDHDGLGSTNSQIFSRMMADARAKASVG